MVSGPDHPSFALKACPMTTMRALVCSWGGSFGDLRQDLAQVLRCYWYLSYPACDDCPSMRKSELWRYCRPSILRFCSVQSALIIWHWSIETWYVISSLKAPHTLNPLSSWLQIPWLSSKSDFHKLKNSRSSNVITHWISTVPFPNKATPRWNVDFHPDRTFCEKNLVCLQPSHYRPGITQPLLWQIDGIKLEGHPSFINRWNISEDRHSIPRRMRQPGTPPKIPTIREYRYRSLADRKCGFANELADLFCNLLLSELVRSCSLVRTALYSIPSRKKFLQISVSPLPYATVLTSTLGLAYKLFLASGPKKELVALVESTVKPVTSMSEGCCSLQQEDITAPGWFVITLARCGIVSRGDRWKIEARCRGQRSGFYIHGLHGFLGILRRR